MRERVESLLVTGSWVEKIKETLGLAGVSQVWSEKPEWYLWIEGAPGVHHLRLEGASIEEAKKASLARGVFAVKCYPHPHHQAFKRFSFEEQALIKSDLFDQTNTPRFEAKDLIPPTLFNVAVMEYALDLEGTWSLFTLESLDAMRVRCLAQVVQDYPLVKQSKSFSPGETARDVPGWALGHPLFDRLLGLYAYASKTRPSRVALTRSPGSEYVYDQTNGLRWVEADDVAIWTLMVLFAPGGQGKDDPGEEIIEAHHQAQDQKIILDKRFAGGHLRLDEKEIPTSPAFNRLWWSLAESGYTSGLASSCGCH